MLTLKILLQSKCCNGCCERGKLLKDHCRGDEGLLKSIFSQSAGGGGGDPNSCNIYSLDVPAKGPRTFILHVRGCSIATSGIVSFCIFTWYLVDAHCTIETSKPVQLKNVLEIPKLPRSFTLHLIDKQMSLLPSVPGTIHFTRQKNVAKFREPSILQGRNMWQSFLNHI